MGEQTGISWTDHTFNPWWGCTKVSAGCKNCYAEAFDKRVGGSHWGPGVPRRTFGEKHWNEPLKWNKAARSLGERQKVFCASMADVFDAEAPPKQRERLWWTIMQTPDLDWQLLTKRPENVLDMIPEDWRLRGLPDNVWIGTSVEDQAAFDERIGHLARIPAKVRFLSMEPLLGPVTFAHQTVSIPWGRERSYSPVTDFIDWVIVGGESGPGHRYMDPEWVTTIRNQCKRHGIPFFFKQWGGPRPGGPRHVLGVIHDEFPEVTS